MAHGHVPMVWLLLNHSPARSHVTLLPDAVWPTAAKRQPRARSARRSSSPNQVLTHAARAAAKQLNKHLFLATNMCVRARATARRSNRIHASQTGSI